jgi:hypothetical protein
MARKYKYLDVPAIFLPLAAMVAESLPLAAIAIRLHTFVFRKGMLISYHPFS